MLNLPPWAVEESIRNLTKSDGSQGMDETSLVFSEFAVISLHQNNDEKITSLFNGH